MAWLARWSHNPRNKAIAHLTHVDRIRRIVTKETLLDDTLDDGQRTNRNEQAKILCRIIRHLGSGIIRCSQRLVGVMRVHSLRSVSLNGMLCSTLPLESKIRTSPEAKALRGFTVSFLRLVLGRRCSGSIQCSIRSRCPLHRKRNLEHPVIG